MKKIMIINGPNLNFLGIREKNIYGSLSYEKLCDYIKNYKDFENFEISIYQSNIEGEIVNFIQKAHSENFDYIVINPGAYTHTSVAILDAIKAVEIPTIEVHLSNIHSRDDFRKNCICTAACVGQISGFGIESYILAIKYLQTLENKNL